MAALDERPSRKRSCLLAGGRLDFDLVAAVRDRGVLPAVNRRQGVSALLLSSGNYLSEYRMRDVPPLPVPEVAEEVFHLWQPEP